MLPEEKVARRFSEKKGLNPPVDVLALIRDLADFEEDALPAGYDALTLDKPANHPRPLVIVNPDQHPTRRVFTLAHELGHIVIPWHNGTHFCRVDGHARLDDRLTLDVELEANRFAGELLMPTAWVQELIESKGRLSDLVSAVMDAGVSCHAASIRLIKLLPPGFFFAVLNSEQRVTNCGCSPDTWVGSSDLERFSKATMQMWAEDYASFKSGLSEVFWCRLAKIPVPNVPDTKRTSSELLGQILTELFSDAQKANQSKMSINGVIGAVNGMVSAHGWDLFTVLTHRFACKPELAAVVNHRLFNEYLARRVKELSNRLGTR